MGRVSGLCFGDFDANAFWDQKKDWEGCPLPSEMSEWV